MKRKTVVLGALGSLALAGGGAIVKGVIEDNWETVGPMVYALWAWVVGVYEWVVHPVAIALWITVLVPLLLLIGIALLGRHTIKLASALKVATAKPELPILTDEAHKVLKAIVQSESNPYGLGVSDLPLATGLSEFLCKAATEDLQGLDFISVLYGRWGSPVTLLPKGRSYIRAPGSPLASLVK
jgi:hypothetical protein